MDSNQFMLSFFFGLIGTGMFMYGKKAGRPIPLIAGVMLILLPYFVPNPLIAFFVCAVVCVVPWFLRDAA